jgi:mono/diheme cytochrome c family protein
MSTIVRSLSLTKIVLAGAVGFALLAISGLSAPRCFADPSATQDYGGQDPGGQDMPNVDPFGQMPGDDMMPRRTGRAKTTKKKSLTSAKSADGKSGSSAKGKGTASKKGSTDSGQIRFSQDIAPIFVANCVNCHSGEGAGLRRGKLDLSTFEGLKKGSQKRPSDPAIVIPGKPDDSHLVLRVRGDEEPRMPQGGNNKMSDEAVGKIAQWVKEGAKLDEGLDPKALIRSYAASPEQVARRKTARLPAQERDKLTESVGLERWKKADEKLKPQIERGEHFMIFSNLPSDRAKSTLKAMETQFGHLRRLLGAPMTDWDEKVGLYVFSNHKDLVNFVRAIESPDADAETKYSAKFMIPQPYLAIADPSGGSKEEPGASKRKGRSKRGESKDGDRGGSDRSLNGELTEVLATNVVASRQTAPRWLAIGLGTYLASRVEPRSPYYQRLRRAALTEFGQGWPNRAMEALGATDRISADGMQGISFALVEAMISGMNQGFSDFVQGMLEGGEKLDDVLREVYGMTRDDYLTATAEWVASHYGQLE